MKYRKDIDGLRALAILPVIMYHTGISTFEGGFIGVDIFFVISGYLITSIIINEINRNNFNLVKFYDRRAKRILPSLFVVMTFSLIMGTQLLMPDELKNLGQSLVATALFSNNILLAVTGNYWDISSDFKPLLHTWSLGVEEQYYLLFPLLLIFTWKRKKNLAHLTILGLFLISFIYANYLATNNPQWSFYLLTTRAWELFAGSLLAIHQDKIRVFTDRFELSKYLSTIGITLIILSIFIFKEHTPSPNYIFLIPIIGTCLIIIRCDKNTVTYKILSYKPIVFTGLISYSLYLWHQPLFTAIRIYSISEPSKIYFIIAIIPIFILSYLSYKFIETPIRKSDKTSPRTNLLIAGSITIFFVLIGGYLNSTYGSLSRGFDKSININDLDKRIYNERAFRYKLDLFTSNKKEKLLITGNSFARDFLNVTIETFDLSETEIIYNDKIEPCSVYKLSHINKELILNASTIVFANGTYSNECVKQAIQFAEENKKRIFFVGTKHFGYNINWLAQVPINKRFNKLNSVPDYILEIERKNKISIPEKYFISLMDPVVKDAKIPITDSFGRLISTDKTHLTKFGAIFFGQNSLKHSSYEDIFLRK